MTAPDYTELRERLDRIEGSRPDSMGICTMWHRNPDGPEASAAIASLQADNEALRAVLAVADTAINEMFRYYDGGEARGSYDGKPERNQLRKAGYAVRAALQPKDQSK